MTSLQAGPDPLAASLIEEASAIVCDLHDDDPAVVHRRLARASHLRLRQLVCVLAAMVPTDRRLADLLAWTTGASLTGPDSGRGTHADCDERPCGDCRQEVA